MSIFFNLCHEALGIDKDAVSLGANKKYGYELILSFPSQSQKIKFNSLLRNIRKIKQDTTYPNRINLDESIYALAQNAYMSSEKDISKIAWEKIQLQLEKTTIINKQTMICVKDFCDIERPFILRRHASLNHRELVNILNTYNLGKEAYISPPLALLWKNYIQSFDGNCDDRMAFHVFRKKLKYYE